MKAVHFIKHHCQASDDCECSVACRMEGYEIQATWIRAYVTCKTCIRMLEVAKLKRLENELRPRYRGATNRYEV